MVHTPLSIARVTTDFTSANSAALQAITGLTIALPAQANTYSFHCAVQYSQATPSAGDQFGIAVLTTAPTNAMVSAIVDQLGGAAGTVSPGTLAGLTTTTPTAFVTFTPANNAIHAGFIDGTVEIPGSGASTFQLYVLNGTAANVIVVKRGSYCHLTGY
jgi:hypothetical protein